WRSGIATATSATRRRTPARTRREPWSPGDDRSGAREEGGRDGRPGGGIGQVGRGGAPEPVADRHDGADARGVDRVRIVRRTSRVTEGSHQPVMVEEVVRMLGDAEVVVDMTLGAGGHAAALLRAGVRQVVGVDRDASALELARAQLGDLAERVRFVRARFSEVDEDVVGTEADGVLFDLGVSSMQLDDAERGFSFRRDARLDMRMAGEADDEPSARDLVNELPEGELADLLYRYGDERR